MKDYFNTPELSQARTESQQATSTASSAAQSAVTLPDMLRDTLTKKFEGNPLYGQRESALTNYMNTTTQAPLDYTHTSAGGNADVVYNPLQQANLIQGRRSAALAPITTLNDLLGLQYGGLDNIIDASSRAAQAQVMGLQSTAEQKRQSYLDLLDLASRQADQDYRYAELNKSSGSGISDLLSLLPLLGIDIGGESSGDLSGLDNLVEREVQGPPGPPKPQSKPIDLRGVNLGFGTSGGAGMGNIPLNTSQSKPKKKKESLPVFQSLQQLGF